MPDDEVSDIKTPPDFPVLVIHLGDGMGQTYCSGEPLPEFHSVYSDVPTYLCQGCRSIHFHQMMEPAKEKPVTIRNFLLNLTGIEPEMLDKISDCLADCPRSWQDAGSKMWREQPSGSERLPPEGMWYEMSEHQLVWLARALKGH